MATHDVNLGVGNSAEDGITGMFYHAPAGTALPTSFTSLPQAWVEVGAISSDGITVQTNRSFEPLKNWANKIARMLSSEDSGTVVAPVIDTTEESLKTIFGEDNVTVTAAATGHGKQVKVVYEQGDTTESEAFLFLMRDEDDIIMVGTENGYISELGDISFAPDDAITWEATITADKWTIMKDDGQTA